jgi:hypothetical protein
MIGKLLLKLATLAPLKITAKILALTIAARAPLKIRITRH